AGWSWSVTKRRKRDRFLHAMCHRPTTARNRPGALLAKGRRPHHRFDAAGDHRLEFRGAGDSRFGEDAGVVAQGRRPDLAAVVVLAPGDRVKAAVPGMGADDARQALTGRLA